jgi:hypothetical protein
MVSPDKDAADNGPGPPAGPLVPLEGGPSIVPGIQAFRRGDVVLYTVRGEPRQVQELMGQLDKAQVGEVIALISHHAPEEAPPDETSGPSEE